MLPSTAQLTESAVNTDKIIMVYNTMHSDYISPTKWPACNMQNKKERSTIERSDIVPISY